MLARLEPLAFGLALAAVIAVPLGPALSGSGVLSPSDLAYAQRSFERREGGVGSGVVFEPANRLLTDPMLQFEPWIAFNRAMLREGRLPLWNGKVGGGAPHLANGQSAVFDPFLAIAYLGAMPGALSWIAAARLWVAGLGMFLLARLWGLGPWGRWFAGLAYPLCGFLTLWLLYPLASVAAWLPWLIAASEYLIRRPSARSVAAVGVTVALAIFGGHVQTAAHCLMLSAAYVLFRIWPGEEAAPRPVTRVATWILAIGLGVLSAGVTLVPLGVYLSRSPAWADRIVEMGSPWTVARPRLVEPLGTAMPNLLGSQRRGHANLAKALGANNQNESSGGFAGLATLIWLAPVGASIARGRVARFLVFTAIFGAGASFRLPPVDNLLRALPVLDVTDHRRMSLWIAFGLIGLGAIGFDRLGDWRPSRRWLAWVGVWMVGAVLLALGAALLPMLEGPIRSQALAHYEGATARSPDLESADAFVLADRQVTNLLGSYPGVLLAGAINLASLAALAFWTIARRGRSALGGPRVFLLAIVLVDLIGTMWGANPTIAPGDYKPSSPVIEHLRREAAPPARVLSVGAELPPNMLLRYGLADLRNYDAIELASMADWLEPLFKPSPDGRPEARSSRRLITWAGVSRSRARLEAAGVSAVVGASPPPAGLFDRVESVGAVWVGHWDRTPSTAIIAEDQDGWVLVDVPDSSDAEKKKNRYAHRRIAVPITFVPGWTARCDLGPLPVSSGPGPWLNVAVPEGVRQLELRYDPPEARLGIALTVGGWAVMAMLGFRRPALEKVPPDAWTDSELGVRIGIQGSPGAAFFGQTPQSEGRDADGPLHV